MYYYTYAYLREDRTPYYIGKGKGNRAYGRRGKGEIKPPKDKSRILILKKNLTEEKAFRHEVYMISVFGRKDLGTGILHNKTNGGDGSSGLIHSVETKIKIGKAQKGKIVSEETKRKLSEANKNPSEETKRKISEANKNPSEETRRKLSEAKKGEKNHNYGKPIVEETRKRMSEAKKDKKWWNDGKGNTKFTEECPGENWIAGRGKIKA
jgi:hypothetical protein